MSDSEEDFMSDKFLLEIPSGSSSSSKSKTYSEKRNIDQLKSMRKGQSKNQIPLKQLEEQRRKEGLSKSLFDQQSNVNPTNSNIGGGGGGVALNMMQKMGWNIGESLGDEEDEIPKKSNIIEPIRISMWNGRRGLQAKSPSPPPSLPKNLSGRDPDSLDIEKLERLNKETDDFRTRQRREYNEKEKERKGRAAREKLKTFDEEKGIKFHPLHIIPWLPLQTIPRPLLKLIYPSQAFSPSPSPPPQTTAVEGYEKESNLSAAEKLREQMRRDMLSTLKSDANSDDDDEEGLVRFGIIKEDDDGLEEGKKLERKYEDEFAGVDWNDQVNGAKRVLAMDPEIYLQFVVDQLRNEHLFCFWCSYKYNSFEEMDGVGGCPGSEEDDH